MQGFKSALKAAYKDYPQSQKKQYIWLNCNTTRDPENIPFTLLFLFTVHWTVGSHPLGGCSLSNLYPISPTKVLTRKLPHIKRNGLGLWRRMQSLSNLWVCLKYDVAPLWDQCTRTFNFTTRSLLSQCVVGSPFWNWKNRRKLENVVRLFSSLW